MVTRMEITACPVCGSKNIGIGTLGDGIISGLSSWKEVCRNCGYQGASLVFESEAEYNKFVAALSHQRKEPGSQTEGSGGTSKETANKQTAGTNGRSDSSERQETLSPCAEKRSYSFEFIVAVVLSIIFFVILYGSRYISESSGVFSQDDLFTMILLIFGSFVTVSLFFFLLIIFIEMIYKSIRRKKTT